MDFNPFAQQESIVVVRSKLTYIFKHDEAKISQGLLISQLGLWKKVNVHELAKCMYLGLYPAIFYQKAGTLSRSLSTSLDF